MDSVANGAWDSGAAILSGYSLAQKHDLEAVPGNTVSSLI